MKTEDLRMRLDKQIKGMGIALAMIGSLVLGSAVASAAITVNFGPGVGNTPTVVVGSQTSAVIKLNQATSTTVGGPLAFTSTVPWPFGTTINLVVNNATFSNAILNASAPGVKLGAALAGAPVAGTLIAPNHYQWTVGGLGAPVGSVFNFDTFTNQVLNVTGTVGAVTFTVTINAPLNVGGGAIDATPVTTGPALNVVPALTATGLVNANTIADVAQLSPAGVPFVYNVAGPALNTLGNTGGKLTITNVTTAQPMLPANIVVKLLGDFTGIAAVNAPLMTASSAAGVPTAGAALNTMTITQAPGTTAGQATAIITAGLAAGGVFNFAPQLVFDGVTQQSSRAFTVAVDIIAGGTFAASPNDLTAASIVSVSNNGLVFSTDLMGTASSNIVVLRDLSNNLPAAGGRIILSGTVFPSLAAGAQAGTPFGPITLAVTVPSGGQAVLTPLSIAADPNVIAAGGLPAGAAASFNFVVASAAGSASEKKQVAGVGINAQTIAIGSSAAVLF